MTAQRLNPAGEIQYGDLVAGPDGLGMPWVAGGTDPATGLDCKGLAFHLLRRVWPEFPDHAVLGLDSVGEADGGVGALDTYLSEMRGAWSTVPVASRVGDLIVSMAAEAPHGPHLSVVVSASGRLALTTSAATGVLALPVTRIQRIQKVLRFSH